MGSVLASNGNVIGNEDTDSTESNAGTVDSSSSGSSSRVDDDDNDGVVLGGGLAQGNDGNDENGDVNIDIDSNGSN